MVSIGVELVRVSNVDLWLSGLGITVDRVNSKIYSLK
jgi:hypothetical protein